MAKKTKAAPTIKITNASGTVTVSRKAWKVYKKPGFTKCVVSLAGKNTNVYRFGLLGNFVTEASLTARQIAKIREASNKWSTEEK